MKKSRFSFACVLLLICSLLIPVPARAAEPLDIAHPCSMTLHYSKEGRIFPGLEIRIYRFAEFQSSDYFALTETFRNYPVKIHGVTSQKEWRDAANTLAAYIIADNIAPTETQVTDSNGTAVFTGLQTGLYLVQGVLGENAEGIYQFENFILFLPTPQSNGQQNYDLEAKPKGTFIPHPPKPEEETYQVVKLWKDAGIRTDRPDQIHVDILKNGAVHKTVKLDSGNNWSYSWKAEKDGSRWTVVEKDVPDPYTVVITRADNTFTITNSRPAPAGAPPQTGDTFLLLPWILGMSFSGMLLMVLGIWHKRKAQ